ncbi:MAG: transketolase family protein [Spirochaetales bacterium]|nr:MAG: transketolase family protein [Spirochaetales bacterium]
MNGNQKSGTRDGFGEALLSLARQYPDVVAMDCDLGRSTRSYRITEVDPSRFIEMGISEQDMVSTAAGLARMGKTVFVSSFAVFLTGRAFDQIRQQVALPRANVKICGSSAGLTVGPDGATHQSVIDLSLMRSLPNMTVLNPADHAQAAAATKAAYVLKGPVYLRLSRYETLQMVPGNLPFEIGKAQEIVKGEKIALCSSGPILQDVLNTAGLLRNEGYSPAVYNFHTLKPVDAGAIKIIASSFEHVITVEEHNIFGGLGSAVAEVIAELPPSLRRCRFMRLGINDCFGESGTGEELFAKHCLDGEGLYSKVIQLIEGPA